ncbi:FAD-dependent oxidoreductase [Streptomyces sp. SID3343]|nr:FAD-dependent oxidoreductase [Streptomyces sp. SID3343]
MLISGASVAGPTLAYWLARRGFEPTVVEVAPALRGGGYAVDFRSSAHLAVLDRTGILDDLRALATGGTTWTFVDDAGNPLAALPPEFTGGDLEVARGDLARVLYERTRDTTEYVFGDSIATLTDTTASDHADACVQVEFESGTKRTFDLVIGADGLHSNTRELAFGPEKDYLTHLGYHVAGWMVPHHIGVPEARIAHNVAGKLIGVLDSRRGPTADVFAFFAAGPLDHDRRDVAGQKRIVADVFADVGWVAPTLIEALADAPELYFDAIARVDVPRWSAGRVALVGDAAYGATLGGMGTGSAVIGAYVLAGELAAAGGNHVVAFDRYERAVRDFVTECQKGGEDTGAFLAPATADAVAVRNVMLGDPAVLAHLLAEGEARAAGITLPDYPG